MTIRNPAATLPLRWSAIFFFIGVHLLALVALWYMTFIHFSWATVVMAAMLFLAMHLSITVGMHRLYAHNAFKATKTLEAILLVLATGILQKSVVWWAGLHRRHHQFSDTERDPYTVKHGFWWAHMGWMLRKRPETAPTEVRDLFKNPLVKWQYKNYPLLAFVTAFVVPTVLGALWGDAIGGLLVGGFLRLCIQYHSTWSINSVAHSFGSRRYTKAGTARTNPWLGLITVGESYHEYHHLAPSDYRLGTRWYDLDPGKWVIWLCSKIGLAFDLKTNNEDAVIALAEVKAAR